MLAAIHGFKPLKTHHCVTGSMRHIYEFHGYPISEDLLLGLGAGIGASYWHFKGMIPFFGGRANVGRPGEEGLEKTAGKRTGVGVELFRTGSAAKAEKALLEQLEAGQPVMVQLDMGFLPYFDLPEGYHFGWHVVVVAGYDPQAREVLVADRDGTLHPVSLSVLAQARGSKHRPFPPQNAWWRFDFSHRRPPKPEELREAILEATAGMLEPPIANIGVAGIRKAARAVLEWPKRLSQAELRRTCGELPLYIGPEGGSGGGFFRYMYGRFLQEAARLTGESRLSRLGQEFRGIGDDWQMLAGVLKNAETAPEPAQWLPEISSRLSNLAGREEAAWQGLRQMMLPSAALPRAKPRPTPHPATEARR
jgi:hypothetical protein